MASTRAAGVVAVSAAVLVAAAPPAAHASSGSVGSAQPAAGSFQAQIDFASLQLQDLPHDTCRLTVDGVLTFTGTLVGNATGTTTALVLAPCADVGTTPPGTYADVFAFTGDFDGTVAGGPADGKLVYAGYTAVGGAIDAGIGLTGDARAVLSVDGQVARGGDYEGWATT